MDWLMRYGPLALTSVSMFVLVYSLLRPFSIRVILGWAGGSVGLLGAVALLVGSGSAGIGLSTPRATGGQLLASSLVGVALAVMARRRSGPGSRWLGAGRAGFVLLTAVVLWGFPHEARPPEGRSDPSIVWEPTLQTLTAHALANGAQIEVSQGFYPQLFASLSAPTTLEFDENGDLFVATYTGEIWKLTDSDEDGAADSRELFAEGFLVPKGLAAHGGALFVSSLGEITRLEDTDGDGQADRRETILASLPVFDDQHSNNGIEMGPDGYLYLSVGGPRVREMVRIGSQWFWEGRALHEWAGTVLRFRTDGSDVQVFARGVRNSYDLVFSRGGELFATDNGEEGIRVPGGDELNLVVQGGDYGFPLEFGYVHPSSPTIPPVLQFRPYSSPNGLTFYYGDAFPNEYFGNLFIAVFHGTPRTEPEDYIQLWGDRYWKGKKIVRVILHPVEGTVPYRGVVTDFARGFERPVAVAAGSDGALYVAEFDRGAIYRIYYLALGSSKGPL